MHSRIRGIIMNEDRIVLCVLCSLKCTCFARPTLSFSLVSLGKIVSYSYMSLCLSAGIVKPGLAVYLAVRVLRKVTDKVRLYFSRLFRSSFHVLSSYLLMSSCNFFLYKSSSTTGLSAVREECESYDSINRVEC